MKGRKVYDKLRIQVIIYDCLDIIAASSNEVEDDFGSWNSDWFVKVSG